MPRYKLTIEYDGTPFVGWQIQENGVSVQGRLAEAVVRFCGLRVIPHGAGRTDAGVHALGQVAHLDLARDWPARTVQGALNHHLRPDPIAVIACEIVSPQFDARFSALARHYLYRIICRRAPLVLARDRAWQVPHELDAAAMQAGARHLIGRHDFTTFRAAQCQAKSPVKTLDVLEVRAVCAEADAPEGAGQEIRIHASARSFMHNQVRSIVGSLKQVGEGRWQPDDIARALAARDRSACGPVAPACGLYLRGVDYPPVETLRAN